MADESEASGGGAQNPAASWPERPSTDYGFLERTLGDASADAFVHVGDRFDDDMRYLTRFSGPDRDFAFVFVADTAGGDATSTLCAPALFEAQANREFPGDEVRMENVGDPAGERARAVLDEALGGDGTVLVPQGIPHDAALYLERAGYELRSTSAVADARAVKTESELDCLRRVQRATARGMARAETILAESTADGDELLWEGGPLSTERLRRQVNATLAAYGVRDAGNTVIGAGPSCADLHFTGTDGIAPGETVLLDISPRGPHGYYGDLTRTFVVDGDGGWERRAYVAVEAAQNAAFDELDAGAGVAASTVHEEAAAEIAAYGFSVGEEPGFTHGTGHGVGVSLHEAPSLRADAPLEAGMVVTVEPGVYDSSQGGVRIEDLVVVTEDGYEVLAAYPTGIVPQER
ncbi:Xaa-Pro peptidase family protein [Haloprofundus sp. MHR1]|uniref:M24 family metallopeptidase n=1 Tax=Haloprofundus sp. MHR1 TaxID=2572921 RepID=UPI0010BE5938|nr:Xaa-Pro peptidase family protein [Haloprofundus sp. MHR1]QCJ47181.1 aminopeptidase P family protein [Haloprofundus sp. MHR1]